MKKTVFFGALLATTVLGASSAYATYGGGPYHPPTPPNPCGTDLCDPNLADFKQTLESKGFPLANECRVLEVCNPGQASEVLAAFLAQYYLSSHERDLPGELIVNAVHEDFPVLIAAIHALRGRELSISHRVRGTRAR